MVPANYASLPANCPTTPIPRDFVSRTVRVPRHGVQEFAVLPLALATQKIATNLDILLLLTHSRQLHLLQRVAVAWRYASFPSNVSTFQCVHETALFPAGTRSVAEIATSVWQFHHRRFFAWRALTRGLLH